MEFHKEKSTSTDMPSGMAIHNIKITLGNGGQLATAKLIGKDGTRRSSSLPDCNCGHAALKNFCCHALVKVGANICHKEASILEFIPTNNLYTY